jgi:hypothetical protein
MRILSDDEYDELIRIKENVIRELNKCQARWADVKKEKWQNDELQQDYLNEIATAILKMEELLA